MRIPPARQKPRTTNRPQGSEPSRAPSDKSCAPLVVKIRDAAAMLQLGRSYIYELLDLGELTAIKAGRSRRIIVASIHDYVARRRVAAKADA
jgi:excisionase family DNA binding protein